jgi:hypothetical protein
MFSGLDEGFGIAQEKVDLRESGRGKMPQFPDFLSATFAPRLAFHDFARRQH